MEVHAIGIDLGKTLFHLVGVDGMKSARRSRKRYKYDWPRARRL